MFQIRMPQKFAAFALAAMMTFGVLASLGALADTTSADAQQLACTMAAPRA
jgi:hypothetical protein